MEETVGVGACLTTIGVTVALSLGLALAAPTPQVDRVIAVFPPWWTADRVFAAAARTGEIVATGPFWSALVMHGSPTSLARRLQIAGAVLTIDAREFGGCNGQTRIRP